MGNFLFALLGANVLLGGERGIIARNIVCGGGGLENSVTLAQVKVEAAEGAESLILFYLFFFSEGRRDYSYPFHWFQTGP